MARMSRYPSCKVGSSSYSPGLAQFPPSTHPSALLTAASSVEMWESAIFGGQAGYPRHASLQEWKASWRRRRSGGRWLDAGDEVAATGLGESIEGKIEPRGFSLKLSQRGELRVGLHVSGSNLRWKGSEAVSERLWWGWLVMSKILLCHGTKPDDPVTCDRENHLSSDLLGYTAILPRITSTSALKVALRPPPSLSFSWPLATPWPIILTLHAAGDLGPVGTRHACVSV